ncbi:MAG: peptidylprolyl isomerase [Sphaerochaetaceae bacterium]|jgi:peptidyl-prolyl cis-trans isomerase C|nr:peptidylprolyl isomerase [Sphaerochaetaceae bacterium]MDD4220197.1 peptidylprolyl isomerase [Sphaerochaetaceae bacterium]MDY0372097.1 peptidylprolyl isomerase [Sphaerochaetaceae bacterium]
MEFRASHILVKDRKLAEDLRKRILGGANFASLARDFSTCSSKSKGGDLGWFGEGAMVAPFEQAVKRMSVGAISPIVPTKFGFHIIKKTGSR